MRTPDGNGYWILFANGAVYPFGDANLGQSGRAGRRPQPGGAIFATADGAATGWPRPTAAVESFGDAPNDGSMSGTHLNGSIIAATGW